MKTSEVLNKAADLIEQRGWETGGGWIDSAGRPLCLEGAIGAVIGVGEDFDRIWDCPAHDAVKAYLGTRLPLFCWNDSLKWNQDADENVLHTYVGGSPATARAYGEQRVIEVLRATAVIEAAREDARVEVSA